MSNIGLFQRVIAVALITFALLTTPAFAEGPGWSANSTVVKLVTTQDGGVNIMLSPGLTNCVSNSGYGATFASVYPSHPGVKSIYTSLLTAYVTGQPVALYFSTNQCTVLEVVLGGW
jgi:hypothetical protein